MIVESEKVWFSIKSGFLWFFKGEIWVEYFCFVFFWLMIAEILLNNEILFISLLDCKPLICWDFWKMGNYF